MTEKYCKDCKWNSSNNKDARADGWPDQCTRTTKLIYVDLIDGQKFFHTRTCREERNCSYLSDTLSYLSDKLGWSCGASARFFEPKD